MSENREAAIRDAKGFVRRVVRTDWEYPTLADGLHPGSASSGESTLALVEDRTVQEWRLREVDSSGSELEPQSSDHDPDADSPHAEPTGDPAHDLRRKRRRQMKEEMEWNEGLRMWMARRDAWSGARTRRQVLSKEGKRQSSVTREPPVRPSAHIEDSALESAGDASARVVGTSPLSDRQAQPQTGRTESNLTKKTSSSLSVSNVSNEEQSRRQDPDDEHSTAPEEDPKGQASTETSITEPDAQASLYHALSAADVNEIEDDGSSVDIDSSEEEALDERLIPVAPPFLPSSNPIRSTITPAIYASIYTKVIVQGMTPTIPINLADLTKAMVQGWKADGQWPPKPAVSNIVLGDDATVPKRNDNLGDGQASARRKNSITSAMRKVFHNPFHRRGSTQDSSGLNGSGTVTSPGGTSL
ncbi:hypothetical protein N7468_007255 [Penicillium chermesinum]|uniref:Gag1-like clamp domain-containing protein n=1 Tax=Penicillium chermesinum TaxID=63820 RepID=A0A9W9NU12_9EURO|nr:uncharacterized protein N7468_007255 [Penicillium chermesinum]KAJ5226030.1 hypothetical protein N7468_007255 [Penicillium chermesinum]